MRISMNFTDSAPPRFSFSAMCRTGAEPVTSPVSRFSLVFISPRSWSARKPMADAAGGAGAVGDEAPSSVFTGGLHGDMSVTRHSTRFHPAFSGVTVPAKSSG